MFTYNRQEQEAIQKFNHRSVDKETRVQIHNNFTQLKEKVKSCLSPDGVVVGAVKRNVVRRTKSTYMISLAYDTSTQPVGCI